jgi:hypothetical protein
MRYAIIKDGKVANIAVADPEYAQSQGWVECSSGVDIGWVFDGNTLLPPPPDTEGEAAKVRAQRDQLLIASDINVLPDRWNSMTVEQQQAWSTYRQALRDITAQAGFPWDVQWPTQPD